jgi:hypothetical protein
MCWIVFFYRTARRPHYAYFIELISHSDCKMNTRFYFKLEQSFIDESASMKKTSHFCFIK